MSAPRVIIVDDEQEIHRILRPAFTACGYEVADEMSGREALKRLASSPPNIVVLDLGLPDMDGQCVLRQARSFFQHSHNHSICSKVMDRATHRDSMRGRLILLGASDAGGRTSRGV